MDDHVPPERHAPTVAIIGSGPSGCYTAQSLRKSWPDAEIVVIEALPVPYGLVRYGVAPDHQGSKAVIAQFDRLFERSGIKFVGNVEIGVDLSFECLTAAFDVVVLATGLPVDRDLGIPRDKGARVVGGGGLIRAMNAYPHSRETVSAALGSDVVLVGLGNVAIDIARLLAKTPAGLAGSDIDDEFLQCIRPDPLRSIRIVGRSSVSEAKFDLSMVRELVDLTNVIVRIENVDAATEGPVIDVLRRAESRTSEMSLEDGNPPTCITFHFGAVPDRIEAIGGRTTLHVTERPSNRELGFEADSIITAIGFCADTVSPQTVGNPTWDGTGVYRVGWCGRGPSGTIAANRQHARDVAKRIVDDLAARGVSGSATGLAAVWPRIAESAVTFSDWRAIDKAEISGASPDRCRRKFARIQDMLGLIATERAAAVATTQQ